MDGEPVNLSMALFHLLILGVASFQILFMLIQWAVFRRREYFFYIAYILSASVCILFRVNEATGLLGVTFPKWINEIMNQPLAICSYWMYVLFGRYFLNIPKLQPKVYKLSRKLEVMFAAFIILKCISIPFNLSYQASAIIYLIAVLIMATAAVPMFVLMLKQKNMLNNFLVLGSLLYVAGGVIGVIIGAMLHNRGEGNQYVYLGLEIGVLLELLLLNTGFALKNKILQQQVMQGQQKIIDKLMKKQKGETD
jgi:7TM diverse intracellular signalling